MCTSSSPKKQKDNCNVILMLVGLVSGWYGVRGWSREAYAVSGLPFTTKL